MQRNIQIFNSAPSTCLIKIQFFEELIRIDNARSCKPAVIYICQKYLWDLQIMVTVKPVILLSSLSLWIHLFCCCRRCHWIQSFCCCCCHCESSHLSKYMYKLDQWLVNYSLSPMKFPTQVVINKSCFVLHVLGRCSKPSIMKQTSDMMGLLFHIKQLQV